MGLLALELSSSVLEIPNDSICCSTLSQEYCWLIGWYRKNIEKATLNIKMPLGFVHKLSFVQDKFARRDNHGDCSKQEGLIVKLRQGIKIWITRAFKPVLTKFRVNMGSSVA